MKLSAKLKLLISRVVNETKYPQIARKMSWGQKGKILELYMKM